LREDLQEWFELNVDSPYMLLVANIAADKRTNIKDGIIFSGIEKVNQVRSIVPAVTHIDYSARIQTVHKETNADFYALITRFKELTGCPILVNTSFNVRGEPMVCSPEDAYKCFMGTDLDSLVIEDFYLDKSKQLNSQYSDYKNLYELD
jgi:carbamoyltransferase